MKQKKDLLRKLRAEFSDADWQEIESLAKNSKIDVYTAVNVWRKRNGWTDAEIHGYVGREHEVHVMDDRNVAVSPICSSCLHSLLRRSCRAYPFPNTIPLDIWCGNDPHTAPWPGDNGLRFQQDPAMPRPTLGDDNLDDGDL